MNRQSDQATHTRWAVSFHTDEDNGLSVDSMFFEHFLFGTLVSVTTNKTLGSASGSFTLTFKKPPHFGPVLPQRQIWRDVEDVWVQLYCIVDGHPYRVLLGLIDSMRGTADTGKEGKVTEVYTIAGRDFGKCFEQSALFSNFNHPQINALPRVPEITTAGNTRSIGTPAHFIKAAIELWFGNATNGQETQWMLPPGLGGGSFFSLLSGAGIQNMSQERHGRTVAPALFQPSQDSQLWDTLNQYSNSDMNELFVDLSVPYETRTLQGDEVERNSRNENQRPTIFLREKPFPTFDERRQSTIGGAWDRLKTHELMPPDVAFLDLSKGGAAVRFNYWQVRVSGLNADSYDVAGLTQQYADGAANAGKPGLIPIWSDDSIARHGLRRKVVTTQYLPIPTGADADEAFELAAAWLKRYHDWFVVAPFELTGQIRCSRAFPEIRVGQKVRLKSTAGDISFYVEGVQHSQRYPQSGQTTLTVTRGAFDSEDHLHHIYGLYEYPRTTTPAEDCFRLGVDFDREAISDAGYLDDQCRFEAVTPAPRANVHAASLGRSEGRVGTDSSFSVQRTGGAVLEIERDGTAPLEGSAESPMTFDLEDVPVSEPETPSPAAEVPLSADALERGDPIRTSEPEPDIDSISDDPIGGLEGLL